MNQVRYLKKMTLLDTFSGIGAFSLAAHRAGIEVVGHSEIDKFRQKVLKKHFPDVPQYGDIRNVTSKTIIDVPTIVTGGTPCQDLSLGGYRQGLAGERSGLWFEYLRVLSEIKPAWFIWENVTGALSSNRGRDFAIIIRGLVELGYGVAWRVLNSQYFGVPQRRRRVFVVGHLGDGRAAQVLFERESRAWRIEQNRKIQQASNRVIGTLTKSSSGVSRPGGRGAELSFLVWNKVRSDQYEPSKGTISTLLKRDANDFGDLVAFDWQASKSQGIRANNVINTLKKSQVPAVSYSRKKRRYVRKLMPIECERAQGFPDHWTAGHSDNQRYKMCGDTITVNVAEWILNRLVAVENDEPVE